jgi:hypothetical protein
MYTFINEKRKIEGDKSIKNVSLQPLASLTFGTTSTKRPMKNLIFYRRTNGFS